MRIFWRWWAFLFGFWLAAYPLLSHAEGVVSTSLGNIAATLDYTWTAVGSWSINGGAMTAGTLEQRCAAYSPLYTPKVGLYCSYGANNVSVGYSCPYTSRTLTASPWAECRSAATSYQCPAGYTVSGNQCIPNSACPVSSTNTAGSCVCNANYHPSGASCIPDSCDLAAAQSANGGYTYKWKTAGDLLKAPPQSGCFSGCRMKADWAIKNADGHYSFTFSTASSGTCNPYQPGYGGSANSANDAAQTASQAESDCATRGLGSAVINGLVTCAPPAAVVLNTTSTTANAAGAAGTGGASQGSSKADVSTACEGTTCTKTTTTTTTDANGVPTVTSSVQTSDRKAFCTENPNLSICKDGSFSGDACDAAPVCTGDAVQCAQAVEAQKLRCALRSPDTSDEYTQYTSMTKITDAQGDSAKTGTTVDLQQAWNANQNKVTTPGGVSCVPDFPITAMGISFNIRASKLCPLLELLKLFLMTGAGLIGLRILLK